MADNGENSSQASNFLLQSPLLASVRDLSSQLTAADFRLVARQLVTLLRDYYVHLPLKRSSLGIDPVQEASLLVDELQFIQTEADFFRRVSAILRKLRDRHTGLRMPSPWRDMVAYLPFAVESYFDVQGRHLVISKLMTDLGEPGFVVGAVVTHWNGTPIQRYVETLSWDSEGANPFSRVAVTLRSLTVRPLGYMAPPDEDWVNVTYQDKKGQYCNVVVPWRVYVPTQGTATAIANGGASAETVPYLGLDRNSLIVNSTWLDLYARRGGLTVGSSTGAGIDTAIQNYRSSTLHTPDGSFGYIRIFSFEAPVAATFVSDFGRLVSQMPPDGLIIDVRSNPGGTIPAGEGLMALFANSVVTPQPLSFRNTAAVRQMGALPQFAKWKRSLEMQFETGEVFTQGYPLEVNTQPSQKYSGPVVLVIDALCYSTTDFFAAGMQDNGLATIIGVDPVTGAGGANVWNHALLSQFVSQAGGDDLEQMPSNVDIDLAVRRSIRVGPNQGLPVEGLGVFADVYYQPTRLDVLGQNEDLIKFAVSVLVSRRAKPR